MTLIIFQYFKKTLQSYHLLWIDTNFIVYHFLYDFTYIHIWRHNCLSTFHLMSMLDYIVSMPQVPENIHNSKYMSARYTFFEEITFKWCASYIWQTNINKELLFKLHNYRGRRGTWFHLLPSWNHRIIFNTML